jgi:hypothetical protein
MGLRRATQQSHQTGPHEVGACLRACCGLCEKSAALAQGLKSRSIKWAKDTKNSKDRANCTLIPIVAPLCCSATQCCRGREYGLERARCSGQAALGF